MAKKTDTGSPAKGAAQPPRRREMLIWGGVLVFVATWMFVLGVLVGRGTAPVHFDTDHLQKELIALREAVLQKEKQKYNMNSEAAHGADELDFYEELKRYRQEAGSDDHFLFEDNGQDPRPSARTPRQKPGAPQGGLAAAHSEAGPGRRYTIQVAAVKDAKLADEMVERLRKKGYPSYRTQSDLPGKGVWFRVRIGHFADRADADRALERLARDRLSGYVVKN